MTREEAYAVLAALGPAEPFLASYTEPSVVENLDIFFGPPEEYFLQTPREQSAYDAGGRLVPLLDDGNFGTILFLDADSGTYVNKYVEAPELPAQRFRNWQQYLAHLVRRMSEGGLDDTRLERVAQLIGFRHLPATLEALDSGDAPPGQEHEERWQAFVAGLSE